MRGTDEFLALVEQETNPGSWAFARVEASSGEDFAAACAASRRAHSESIARAIQKHERVR